MTQQERSIDPEIAEVWKPIPNYESLYEVSNKGRVRNTKGRALNAQLCRKKRLSVTLTNGTPKKMLVHRLVGMAFLYKPPGKDYINHIDGNPSNNHVENLEWCTMEENFQHARDNKLWKGVQWDDKGKQAIRDRNSIPVYSKCLSTGNINKHSSALECSKYLNVSQPLVTRAIKNLGSVSGHLVSFSQTFDHSEHSKRYSLSVECLYPNGEVKIFKSSNAAGKELGMCPRLIRDVCKGKYSQYKNHKFQYHD